MSLLLYASKIVLVSGILYSYYWFALRNKQFHVYNRFFLNITVLISFILPNINISLLKSDSKGASRILHAISLNRWEDAVVITPQHGWMYRFFTWQVFAWMIYIAVSLIMIFFLARTIQYIRRISKKYRWEIIGNIKIFHTKEPQSPFSYFKKIFWNDELDIQGNEGNQILRHEFYHVRQNHSCDLLFLEIVKCIFWFNPFFYLLQKEIKVIHEFLADEYAASEHDRILYAKLLILQTINNKKLQIANAFFHNQIKRRIAMITQPKFKRYNYLSRLMALPILFLLFCAFAMKTGEIRLKPGLQSSSVKEDSVQIAVEHYLINHLHYPASSLKSNYSATVNVKVLIDASGKCKTITPLVEMPVDTKTSSLEVESQVHFAGAGFRPLVVESGFDNPKFIPFKETVTNTLSSFRTNRAGTSDVTLYLRILFKIDQAGKVTGKIPTHIKKAETDPIIQPVAIDPEAAINDTVPQGMEKDSTYSIVFTKVEVESGYPGGSKGWQDYLYKTFHYPNSALNNEIQGTVVVQFIVDAAGNVSNVKAISGPVDGGLREEAIRVVKNSGKWIPAEQNGKKVNAYKRQPIRFMLQENK
jgi:TonB family protein